MVSSGSWCDLGVITATKIGIEHLAYYVDSARQETAARAAGGVEGAVRYYGADTPVGPGVWLAAGAMGVGVGEVVTEDQLRDLLSCRDPGTGEQLGRTYRAGGSYRDKRTGLEKRRRTVSAYDLTFSVPKSVSALWALAPTGMRAEVEEAVFASFTAGIDYLQQRAVVSRKGTDGVHKAPVPDGATVAGFLHTTSRADDPHLHLHTLWPNRVRCDDGRWRTLDGRAIYGHRVAAATLAGAVLRVELAGRLGTAWGEVDERHQADLVGMRREVIDAWSQRTRQVQRVAEAKIAQRQSDTGVAVTPGERKALYDAAAVESRPPKSRGVGDPHERWAADIVSLGLDPHTVVGDSLAAAPPPRQPYGRAALVVTDADRPDAALTAEVADAVAAQVETSKVRLTDADLDQAVAEAITAHPSLADRPASRTAAEAVAAAAASLRSALVDRLVGVEADTPGAYGAQLWHSGGLVAAETAVADWLCAQTVAPAGVPARPLDVEGLSADQITAAQLATEATTNGVGIVGAAGAGKTTALARVVDALGADRVLALAPTAAAAATLSEKIGAPADTVARALVTSLHHNSPIPAGGVVIVDEATQLGTRDLAALAGHCTARGARMIVVGDPRQQGSVAAGNVFSTLVDCGRLRCAFLTHLWRFEDPHEAAATAQLRIGDPAAIDYHRDRGRVSDGAGALAADVAADWWQHHLDVDTLISATGLETTAHINAEIADRRHALGHTGDVVAHAGGQRVRVGDLVVTRRNRRDLAAGGHDWVRNGQRWVVAGGRGGRLNVADPHDPTATVTLPADYVDDHVQLGYATTHTRAQSLTVDRSLTLVGASTTREAAYVGLSRGRHGNWLHIITDTPSFDPDVPTQHQHPDQVLGGVLERCRPPDTAADLTRPGPLGSPALHLARIARTPHHQPLPVPAGIDLDPWTHPARRRLSPAETVVQADIAAWLDSLDHDRIAELIDAGHYDTLDSEDSWACGWQAEPPELDPDTVVADELAGLDDPDHPHPGLDADRPQPAEPTARQGIDIDAVQAAVATRGLAEWISARFGVKADQPTGTTTRVECPLHRPGHTRSAVVYAHAHRHTFTCFRCSETHDAIGLVQAHDNIGFAEALRAVAADFDLTDTTAITPSRPAAPPIDLRPPLDPDRVLPDADPGDAHRAAQLLAALDAPTAAPAPHPAWSAAIAAHHTAIEARDPAAAHAAARRIAALADPSVAAELAQAGITPDSDQATARTQIAAARWTHHQDRIVELTELRRRHRLDRHSEARWADAVDTWLRDPAAEPISAAWARLADPGQPRTTPHGAPQTIDQLAGLHAIAAVAPQRVQPLPLTAQPAPAAPHGAPAHAGQWQPDPAPAGTSHAGHAALERAADWYRAQLQADTPAAAEARRYLASRGITAAECEQWGIGWAPDAWHALCDDRLAHDIGVAAQSKNGRAYDFMRGRLTFELRDPAGRVIGFAGRTLDTDPDVPKYVNTRNTAYYQKSKTLYGADQAAAAIHHTGRAVVVEGYTDVIACHQAGVANTVAACGTAISDNHLRTLAELDATGLTALFDGDQAGQTATNRLARRAANHQLPTRAARLPADLDPADLTGDELADTLASAEPPVVTAITAATQNHHPADARQTRRQLNQALAGVDLSDPVTHAIVSTELAARLGPSWQRALPAAQPRISPVAHHNTSWNFVPDGLGGYANQQQRTRVADSALDAVSQLAPMRRRRTEPVGDELAAPFGSEITPF